MGAASYNLGLDLCASVIGAFLSHRLDALIIIGIFLFCRRRIVVQEHTVATFGPLCIFPESLSLARALWYACYRQVHSVHYGQFSGSIWLPCSFCYGRIAECIICMAWLSSTLRRRFRESVC